MYGGMFFKEKKNVELEQKKPQKLSKIAHF